MFYPEEIRTLPKSESFNKNVIPDENAKRYEIGDLIENSKKRPRMWNANLENYTRVSFQPFPLLLDSWWNVEIS